MLSGHGTQVPGANVARTEADGLGGLHVDGRYGALIPVPLIRLVMLIVLLTGQYPVRIEHWRVGESKGEGQAKDDQEHSPERSEERLLHDLGLGILTEEQRLLLPVVAVLWRHIGLLQLLPTWLLAIFDPVCVLELWLVGYIGYMSIAWATISTGSET